VGVCVCVFVCVFVCAGRVWCVCVFRRGCDLWGFEEGVGLGEEGGGGQRRGGRQGREGGKEEGNSEAQHEWAGSGGQSTSLLAKTPRGLVACPVSQ
jgi:hypothetical protein